MMRYEPATYRRMNNPPDISFLAMLFMKANPGYEREMQQLSAFLR